MKGQIMNDLDDRDCTYGVPTGYVPRIRESATDYNPREHHGFVVGKIEQLSTDTGPVTIDTVPYTGNTSSSTGPILVDSGPPYIHAAPKVDQTVKTNHNHYFKSVKHLNEIDVYRVLDLFEVTDPCIQHAVKKLLVAGGRGAGKGFDKDIQEAIDSLKRLQVMRSEDVSGG